MFSHVWVGAAAAVLAMVCDFCLLHYELLICCSLDREALPHPSHSDLGDEPLVQRAMRLALCLAVQLDRSPLTYQTINGMLGNNHFSWIKESRMKEKES